jgi:two-component system, response regulator
MDPKAILLVEDNADDEALTIRALKKAKIKNEIVVARDGAEAIDYLFGTNPIPHVILLDLKLPKIDGHEVLKQVRANEKTKLLPVVILTSSKEERDLHRGYSEGANSYIVKPVDMEQFMNAVQHLSLYWLVLNESSVP